MIGRIFAGCVLGWLLLPPVSLQAGERPGPRLLPAVAARTGGGARAAVAFAGVAPLLERPSAGVASTDPLTGPGVPEDEGLGSARPAWGGFIGTMERQVRLMLERAAECRQRGTVTWPPRGDPGGGGSDDGDGSPAGQTGPVSEGGAPGSTLPVRLWFGPAFPNPSVGLVTFRVELPTAAVVRIAILDIAGRLVGEIRESRAAGRHALTWDSRARARSAGVYLARLEVDGRPVGVRRLVVFR